MGRADRPKEKDGRQEGHGETADEVPLGAQRAEEGGDPGGVSKGRGRGGVYALDVGIVEVVVVIVIGWESRKRKGKNEGVAGIGGGRRTTKVDVNSGASATTTATAVSKRNQHQQHSTRNIINIKLHSRPTTFSSRINHTTRSTFNNSISTGDIKRQR